MIVIGIALAVTLPIAFHQFSLAGRIWLPMHLPVLLAGFLGGPVSGLLVGLGAPLISHLITGMPPTYAVPLMTVELAIYGLVAGMAYARLGLNVVLSLVLAMIAGRLLFGVSLALLNLIWKMPYGAVEFFARLGFADTSWPGLLVQLVTIPPLVAIYARSQRTSP